MTATPASPLWRLVRYFIRPHLTVYGAFWAIVILTWLAATTFVERLSFIEGSVFTTVGLSAPKWFLFVFSLVMAVEVKVYVSYGITRRHVFAASAIALGATALGFALLTLAIFLLEQVIYERLGISERVAPDLLITSVLDGVMVVAASCLIFVLYAACGWMAGAGFSRFGPWRGSLFVIPACAPLAAVELASRSYAPASGFGGLSGLGPAWGSLLAVGATALAVLGAYLIVRDLPIRKVSG
jgi:hypothetical protein